MECNDAASWFPFLLFTSRLDIQFGRNGIGITSRLARMGWCIPFPISIDLSTLVRLSGVSIAEYWSKMPISKAGDMAVHMSDRGCATILEERKILADYVDWRAEVREVWKIAKNKRNYISLPSVSLREKERIFF